jgi:hypothetical protein
VGTAGAFTTVRVSVAVAVDDLSVSFTANVKAPATVGVPEMIPVACPRVSPEGRLPEAMLHFAECDAFAAARVAL